MNIQTYIPSQKRFDKVIHILSYAEKWMEENKVKLSMDEIFVSDNGCKTLCRTTLCVGGAYALASVKMGYRKKRGSVDFTHGANWMAEDMGFETLTHLKIWANINLERWGNYNGYKLFSSPLAYTPGKRKQATKPAHITQHFTEVAMRCQLLQLEKS